MLQKLSIALTPPAWAAPYLTRLFDIGTAAQLLEADDESLSEAIGRIRSELGGKRLRNDEPYRGLPTVAAVREAIMDSLPVHERSYWQRRLERRSQNINGPAPFEVTSAGTAR